jgi:FkbH-like protein
MTTPVRCLLIADFTVDGLAPFLAAQAELPSLHCQVAPFGQMVQTLLDDSAACWAFQPEVAVVWSRPGAAVPAFGRFVRGERVDTAEIRAEVDLFAQRLRAAAQRVGALFVPTWTWPAHDRGLGLLNLDVQFGPTYQLLRMNAQLAEAVQGDRAIHLLDAGRWVALAGANASNPKLWHLGKIAFGPEVFRHAAADVKAGVRAVRGQSRKLLVVDLDDTLWGGVVGDVGWENLELGGHHPVGEAFVAFQHALAALTRRGVVLGIVSKNTEPVALEAIERHPEMVLRLNDFVGWRINWADKAQNLIDLAAEVNVGLDAVVFIDDNPAERARVREALPQVLVPEWPSDRLLYEKALGELTCFDSAALSDEDQARTRMYVAERQRSTALQSASSVEEYLASLGLRVTVEGLSTTNLPRAAQLLNKTNQMNLTTRRLSEAQLFSWAREPGHCTWVFRVSDRFDDYGLTGLASVAPAHGEGQVADFVLSCRVIGRGVEEVMLATLVECARGMGLQRLVARYVPTPRNAPCQAFFDRSGFTHAGEEVGHVWDASRRYPVPGHVEVCFASVDADAAPPIISA